ncbi:hypothetical protein Tco_1143895 [Tanacetum coccineum]
MNVVTTGMCQVGMARTGYARVLVEVTTQKELPTKIDVAYKNKENEIIRTKIIQVIYNCKPPCCNECGVFGHNNEGCPKNIQIKRNQEIMGDSVFVAKQCNERFTKVGNTKFVKQSNRNGQGNTGQLNNQDYVGNAQQKENNKKHDKPVYQVKKNNVSNNGNVYEDNGKGTNEGLESYENVEEVVLVQKSGEIVTKKKGNNMVKEPNRNKNQF